jgi:RNA recognition motif-containing protein
MKLNRLYVGNIPKRLSKKVLFKLFGEYGKVLDVFIPFNRNVPRTPDKIPVNMGYAFVEMDNHDGALQAINALHNKYVFNNKFISVRIADLRNENSSN